MSLKGERRKMVLALLVLLLAIALGAAGQILLKAGVNQLGVRPAPLLVLRSIFTNGMVFGGFFCYAVSSLFYIVALSRLPLSYAYPLIALSYVMVTFLAWWLLHEQVPASRLAALAVILAGVVILAFTYPRPAATAHPGGSPTAPITDAPPR